MLIDNSSFASGQILCYPNGGSKVVRFTRRYRVVDGRFLEDTFRIALTLILTAKTNTAVFTPNKKSLPTFSLSPARKSAGTLYTHPWRPLFSIGKLVILIVIYENGNPRQHLILYHFEL